VDISQQVDGTHLDFDQMNDGNNPGESCIEQVAADIPDVSPCMRFNDAKPSRLRWCLAILSAVVEHRFEVPLQGSTGLPRRCHHA
jgi:hypothetical protein